ncbi:MULTISPECIES: excalibur calcium-binding domain-containing protein [Alphaproteobacteria]|uniref:Excalibur calcium-binding domain-containing protein n=1 Tax=Ciceribacter naphthalenivorans TaxID=1118451 RepID=A0A512HMJ5_9HYPH|nr:MULTISPECIES: excalibur calcium-binding domain-containing protein [Alphaproteobacteria]GEO86610.1 hypothetical protein RNA01_35420 [Ciceribacter naphthalenivorans]
MVDKGGSIVFNPCMISPTVYMPSRHAFAKLLIAMLLFLPPVGAEAKQPKNPDFPIWLAAGRTCKQVANCAEAVELWCSGYSRADADHDGIPCENVCHSRDEVDRIRGTIGC